MKRVDIATFKICLIPANAFYLSPSKTSNKLLSFHEIDDTRSYSPTCTYLAQKLMKSTTRKCPKAQSSKILHLSDFKVYANLFAE